MEKTGNTWAAQDAKAKFSEVLDRVEAGAEQTITRHGKEIARIVPITTQEPKLKTGADFARMLLDSPLRGSGLKIKRSSLISTKSRTPDFS